MLKYLSIIACMDFLSFILCVHGAEYNKKAPSPARLLRQKGRSCDYFCSAVPPGFRLHKGRRRSNAVTGRNRPVLIDASASFAQTARERTSAPAAHGSPFSRWSFSLCCADSAYSLRRCVWYYDNQELCYHILRRFASGANNFPNLIH